MQLWHAETALITKWRESHAGGPPILSCGEAWTMWHQSSSKSTQPSEGQKLCSPTLSHQWQPSVPHPPNLSKNTGTAPISTHFPSSRLPSLEVWDGAWLALWVPCSTQQRVTTSVKDLLNNIANCSFLKSYFIFYLLEIALSVAEDGWAALCSLMPTSWCCGICQELTKNSRLGLAVSKAALNCIGFK